LLSPLFDRDEIIFKDIFKKYEIDLLQHMNILNKKNKKREDKDRKGVGDAGRAWQLTETAQTQKPKPICKAARPRWIRRSCRGKSGMGKTGEKKKNRR
jgi:hypothetical protein